MADSQYPRNTFGTKTVYLSEVPLQSESCFFTPLTQDHRGDLWHRYACIYTQLNADKTAVVEFTYER